MSGQLHIRDWEAMTGQEKESFVFQTAGITKQELARVIVEYELNHLGRRPNAIFLSIDVLAQFPVRIKTILNLRIIPMESKPEHFIVSLEDPDKWGDLFFT